MRSARAADRPSASDPAGRDAPPFRLAVVGCGAITARRHLHAAVSLAGVEVVALVDRDVERARELASAFAIRHALEDARELEGLVDGAIVAVPNRLHRPVAVELLQRALHILVEKPMATSVVDCDAMIDAARHNGRVLAVGQNRRMRRPFREAKRALEAGLLGSLCRLDVEEGTVFEWPSRTTAFLDPTLSGGGVLADLGSHVFDTLRFLWGPGTEVLDYADDHAGGVEAECEIRVRLASGTEGSIRLSRLRRLANSMVVEGEAGRLTVRTNAAHASLELRGRAPEPAGGPAAGGSARAGSGDLDAGRELIADWIHAIRAGAPPVAPPEEARDAIALIEACQARRRELVHPWVASRSSVSRAQGDARGGLGVAGAGPSPSSRRPSAGARPTVLVTGGTGFIGARLVEKLAEDPDLRVRVLARRPERAVRIGRFAVEIVVGDVTDADAVRQATEGCDVVFHCARGDGPPSRQWAATVEGARNVAEAALRARVSRLVHVGSVAVYGAPDVRILDESAPRVSTGPLYRRAKGAAEELLLDLHRRCGLPVVVLQPTIVYGPFGGSWTTGKLAAMRWAPVALPDRGEGSCNAVYVDDVVDAMLLAAWSDAALGRTLLVSGAEVTTWRTYFEAFERMLGRPAVVLMSDDEMARTERADRRRRAVADLAWRLGRLWRDARDRALAGIPVELARPLLPKPLHRSLKRVRKAAKRRMRRAAYATPRRRAPRVIIPSENERDVYRTRWMVSIDAARRVLGFEPAVSLDEGMRRTEEWMRWARLL
jgi:predicted dehydrogenase/nucleoside-diphosphate-sugar epimerase